jgi:uncharacterized protein YggE
VPRLPATLPRRQHSARPLTGRRLTALIALAAPLLLSAALPARAAGNEPASIRVNGEGSVSLAPDTALLSLTVTREAGTAREAVDASSQAMSALHKAMAKAGIEQRDLQTGAFSIQPRYQPQPRRSGDEPAPPHIAGYTARNTLNVRVRDLTRVGSVLDTAVALGVNEGGQIVFTNEDPAPALEQARIAAVKDALNKARTLASAAGVRCGQILSLNEQAFNRGPVPMGARAEQLTAMDAAVPVAPGENTYRVVVNLSVAIEQ